MSGFTDDLLAGLALALHDAGIGRWPDAEDYDTDDTLPLITLKDVPQAPDRLLALAVYRTGDQIVGPDNLGLQVRSRGIADTSTDVDDIDDTVRDWLHARENFTLPTGIHIDHAARESFANLGVDDNGRWENTSNYSLWVDRPSENTDA